MITNGCEQDFRLDQKWKRLLEAVYLHKVPIKSKNHDTAYNY